MVARDIADDVVNTMLGRRPGRSSDTSARSSRIRERIELAHGGRLDKQGGHRNRKNKTYHFHRDDEGGKITKDNLEEIPYDADRGDPKPQRKRRGGRRSNKPDAQEKRVRGNKKAIE